MSDGDTGPVYEWDEVKRRSNIAKHGVDFTEMASSHGIQPQGFSMIGTRNRDGSRSAIEAGIAADPDTRELTKKTLPACVRLASHTPALSRLIGGHAASGRRLEIASAPA